MCCAALLLMYHRQRVLVLGLPRETAAAFAGFYCIASTVDRTEEPGYFFLSSTWLLVTLLWFILQSCLKPSNKQIDQLIRNYENSQLPFAYPAAPAGVVVGAPVAVGGAPLGGAPPQAGGSGGPLQNSSYAAASQRREGSPGAPPQGATEMTTAAEAEPVVLGNVRSAEAACLLQPLLQQRALRQKPLLVAPSFLCVSHRVTEPSLNRKAGSRRAALET
ncbi:hypothetical protein Efla_001733 [Eimeria flavescens]